MSKGLSTETADVEKVKAILENYRDAMLVTTAADGSVRARPMAIARRTDEKGHPELWFATRCDSPKVQEIQREQRVNVVMQGNNQFLSISGNASISKDKQKISEMWSETWKPWFPQGKDDPQLVLIKVTPQVAEYWDLSKGSDKLEFLFEAAKAIMHGQPMKDTTSAQQHQKVQL